MAMDYDHMSRQDQKEYVGNSKPSYYLVRDLSTEKKFSKRREAFRFAEELSRFAQVISVFETMALINGKPLTIHRREWKIKK